jgi:PAS domain S-box-containing protein
MSECSVTPLDSPAEPRSEALFFLDTQGRFTSANDAFGQLAGQPAEALPGCLLAELLVPGWPHDELLERALRGEVLTLELPVRGADGQRHNLLITTFPLLNQYVLVGVGAIVRAAEDVRQAEKAVLEQEQQLSIIFQAVADIIFVLRVEEHDRYRVIFANRALLDATGLAHAQVVGRYVPDIVPADSLELALTHIREVVQTGQRATWQTTSDYPAGRRTGEVCLTPLFNAQNECCQLVGVVHDLTTQKQTEECLRASNERFLYALKATTDALYDWDVRADTLLWGEGFEDLFGYQLESNPSAFGQWADFVHPDDAPRTVDTLRHTALRTKHNHWQQEYRFRRADGSWAVVFDRGYIIRDAQGQAVRMIGAMQDITARKDAESTQRLMTQELLRHNADLQQFTYIVSHNLRAPLANARGFADLLTQVPKDDVVFDTSLQHLQTSIQQLDLILKDITAILSIRDQPEPSRREPVRLAEVLEQVRQTMDEVLRSTGSQLTASIPADLSVLGNRAYVYSIFYNLLSNAVKYRAAGRPLRVECAGRRTPQGGVVLTITDNGSGFDLDKTAGEVFQLYKRFHTSSKGRGIGLFLVKSHVEAMGGRIEVSSRVGEGTRFTLSFD